MYSFRSYFTSRKSSMQIVLVLIMTPVLVFGQIPHELRMLKKTLANSQPDSSRADILLDVGTYFLYKTGEAKSDLDSSEFFRKKAFKLSTSLKYHKGIGRSLLLKSELYHEKGDNKTSWAMLQKTVKYCSFYNLNEQVGNAYRAMSVQFSNDGNDLEKRIFYSRKAMIYFEKANSKIYQAQMLEVLGDLYQIKEDFDTSIDLLKCSLSIYDSIGFKHTQGVYNLLGYVYFFKGYNYKALDYLLTAIKIAEKQGDKSPQLATIYYRLGSVYMNLKQYEKTISVSKAALLVAKSSNDSYADREINLQIVDALIEIKSYKRALIVLKKIKISKDDIFNQTLSSSFYSKIYLGLQQYKQARIYLDLLESFTKKYGDQPYTWRCFYMISILYHFQTRQYEAANLASIGADAENKLRARVYTLVDYELYWSKIDSALGKDVSALKHYKIYKILSDSISNNRNTKQLLELQLQYDTEKKDQDILLLTQQSQLQDIELHNQKIVGNVIIGGLIILLIFSGLMYNRYLLKQRANKRLGLKQQEINKQNKLLQKLVTEKEWLLKEIHHRVKNNLQIVISLLNSQSAFLENEDALLAIQNSQHRMHAMSLIHQKLYQSGNMDSIDMHWYIHELVNYMKDCFSTNKKVAFVLDVEQINLDVAQAVPLGLILNEAITNAIKYAFREGEKGKVVILFKKQTNNTCLLKIVDNGIGLPVDFSTETTESLGMSLMRGLSEQLDGSLEVHSDEGLVISVLFKNNLEKEFSELKKGVEICN